MESEMTSDYTFGATLNQPIEAVLARTETALADQGFGVLTRIDLAATLKAKLGIDRPPYLILGVCNPGLANLALDIDPSIGALLPCSVVLREDGGAGTRIEIPDPIAALAITGSDAVGPVATEAAERLRLVLDAAVAA